MLFSRVRKRTYLSSGMQENLSRGEEEERFTVLDCVCRKRQFPRSFALQTSLYRQSEMCGNAIANCLPTQIGLGQKVECGPQKAIHQKQNVQVSGLPPSPHRGALDSRPPLGRNRISNSRELSTESQIGPTDREIF